ncbi:two-component sensor histidine kinase [Rhodococcus rhodnii]|uniref:Signal transduction histidine kinase subgroup 3 dimerisation and phosphoacceptor domain-containing protein n=2 Tax=Rhodococcus rhodnii TaxID=38312 RepID=R7WQS8_9NOCA|nr:histidine kinase [Rhodococcus rhodnii]EOM76309.1 hypothetical protein Rrhod_2310 [Rhodococcus rhodnii LMG 5362]TXG89984.1 two-component sensor histidine kinase [Rhodococcus rhodnii]
MLRRHPETIGGAALLVVCLVSGVPVLAGGVDLAIPLAVWAILFGCYVAALATTAITSESERRMLPTAALAVSVGTVATLVLTAPGAGWLPILLVFTAALAVYVVPPGVCWLLVAANTGVIAVASMTHGARATDAALGAAIYLLLQVGVVASVIADRRREQANADLAVANTELAATAAVLAETSREQQRLEIARDLHDALGHQLTALALELEVASHKATEPAAEHVARARVLARELLADVRASVSELRDRPTDLAAALDTIAQAVPHPVVTVTVAPDVETDTRTTATLVRVAQEVVTNAIRHSGARRVDIDVRTVDGRTVLDASDDGHGARALREGNGLTGIRERIEGTGGTVTFVPHDEERGFRVRAVTR